jgi:hypothetical protein
MEVDEVLRFVLAVTSCSKFGTDVRTQVSVDKKPLWLGMNRGADERGRSGNHYILSTRDLESMVLRLVLALALSD